MSHRTLTIEEAEKEFHLHRSPEEAMSGGSASDMVKIRVESDSTSKKLKEAEIKARHLEMEDEIQLLRNEGARAKAEQDLESARKKNLMEWPRIITGFLVATAAFMGMVLKVKKKAFC